MDTEESGMKIESESRSGTKIDHSCIPGSIKRARRKLEKMNKRKQKEREKKI